MRQYILLCVCGLDMGFNIQNAFFGKLGFVSERILDSSVPIKMLA